MLPRIPVHTQQLSVHMPRHMSEHMPKHMPKHMSKHMSQHMSKHMFKHMSQHMSQHMSKRMSTQGCQWTGQVMRDMHAAGVAANDVAFNSLMKVLVETSDVPTAETVLVEMRAAGIAPTVATYNMLLGAHADLRSKNDYYLGDDCHVVMTIML